ncbi:MAG: ATP-binding cassette domain-containing protein, partial [Clostridia bacterium]|nr:ATP-binding cassette domain-containing protein [Clostridia bacterium]
AFSTLSGYFLSPVGRLVSLQLQIQEANISMKRISEILDYEEEQEQFLDRKYVEIDEVKGSIELENVTFRYGSRKPAVENINISIPMGKKVALVGGSGSGKSTIAKLLLKYYEPEDGRITIDGVDIRDYDNDYLRRAISYMPQNVELFSKSIYENIRLSKLDATFEEVEEAAKAADAHEFICNLPLQYRTYLEEAGNGLSGGEKQRIALARAFLKKSNFYIFDEGTSNLDFVTENAIFDMLYNRLKNKSMLIVAHRLATVKHCDEIIVMDKGHIVERGTHNELLNLRGKYYEMWQLQQGDFKIPKQNVDDFIFE